MRFLIAGAANALATYLLYLALLGTLGYRLAYTISFMTGILFGYVANSRYVFRAAWSWRKLVYYPILYGVQYATGLLLLELLIEVVQVDDRAAPIIVASLLVPASFTANRWFLKHWSLQ